MAHNIVSKWSLLSIGVMATVCSIGVIFFHTQAVSVLQVIAPDLVSSEQLRPALPVRLQIPRIGVDADFQYVGLTASGAMDVPKDPSDVAWFQLGPRPGEIGSAVIAGHEGWARGVSAVFDSLHKVHTGDEIVVEDERGATIIFIVRDVQIYSWSRNASKVFSSTDGKRHLNLITCEGVWNAATQSYADRLVVFADMQ